MSLGDVQAVTKIRIDYLEALEAGKPEDIPGEVFVKGFLRSYANAVGLDAQTLVERYKAWHEAHEDPAMPGRSPEELPEPAAPSGPVSLSQRPRSDGGAGGRSHRGRRRTPRGLWGVAMRVAFLAALAVFFYVLATASTGEQETSPRAHPQGGGPPAAPPAVQPPPAPPVPPTPPPPAVTVEKSVYGRRVTYLVRNAPSLRVEAGLTDSCWVLVQVDGRTVFQGTLPPGSRQTWEAPDRLFVRAGRPTGLRLAANGVALDPLTDPNPLDLVFVIQRDAGQLNPPSKDG